MVYSALSFSDALIIGESIANPALVTVTELAMSLQLIQQYHAKVERIMRYSGSRNESALRKPFQDLLEQYAASRHLLLVAEVEYRRRGGRVIPDGTLKDVLRQDWGYWESKDEKDSLADEIAAKLAKGYPTSNILFEDTHTAVLYQADAEVCRADFADAPALDSLLTRFISYESEEVRQFHTAIDRFNADVPALATELRAIISEQIAANHVFRQALDEFLELCRRAINPRVEMADVREMIIQHVLTEDIFMTVFDEPQFHRENAIARKLQEVVATFYRGATQRRIHARIAPYYETINARAAQIYNHHEKQKFLKALYESFYRTYNPKAADRLGIIYTPDEIVRFMIEGADHLVFKHFGKTLGDEGVEILDPATGTGTFVTELIEYLPPAQVRYKYLNELHCNEVAILPYYIANLNIEYTYKQRTGEYLPFQNICFVDTLDNLGFASSAPQMDFFGLVDENAERIERQNKRRISVVIGNPPYNAWQENYNSQNPNRPYKEVDKLIRETYVKYGTAQSQIAVYDMYTRFYRWASDRLDHNGIIAFVTNSSFLDKRTFDGFRKVVADEFSHIYVIDLGGNVRDNPKLSGPTHNVFGVQAGVTIAFMVRKEVAVKTACRIFYARRPEMERAKEKLEFLRTTRFSDIAFESIHPDQKHNWLNQTDNDFDALLPLTGGSTAIFELFSNGVKTQRDDWVYDISKTSLEQKMRFFVEVYQAALADHSYPGKMQIKWDRELTKYLDRGVVKSFVESQIVTSLYRPFTKRYLYLDGHFNGMTYRIPSIFPTATAENVVIAFSGPNSPKPFTLLTTDLVPDLNFLSAAADGCRCLPLYRYTADGERVDNITDWALAQFRARYGPHPQSLSRREREDCRPERVALASLSHGERGDAVVERHDVAATEGREDATSPSPCGRGAGGEGDESPVSLSGGGAGGEGNEPPVSLSGRGAGGEGNESPVSLSGGGAGCEGDESPVPLSGRGAGGEGNKPPNLKPPLPPELLQRVRELRQGATQAEQFLWQLFRNRQLMGFKFRRQHPLRGYIIDFYCHEARLAVELDGRPHAELEQAIHDSERTEALALEGVRVLRFWNQEVLHNTEAALQAILDALTSTPPLPLGEGSERSSPGVRETEAREITKRDIFHYVYAVLHHPAYRTKYERNLKRELPRIPFYDDFWQWMSWGEQLMTLHLEYEQVTPFPLAREDKDQPGLAAQAAAPKPRLIARPEAGVIEVDTITTLRGVPAEAWECRLGTYSALEWVLDRHKERVPKDPTIREKFNSYRFADYKEQVIDLLCRVCTVSVETMRIIRQMP